ncbi:hypothetical protein EJB05_49883, partial [Eragrostis curvula]
MDATLLLLSADCPAAAGGRRRLLPALPMGPRMASTNPCSRFRASFRASAAAAAPAVRGLPHHASVAGVSESRSLSWLVYISEGGYRVQSSGIYTVGDFMTKREELHVVKPTTSVDEALEMLVEHRITGFPVIDDDWNLVGTAVVSLKLLCFDVFLVGVVSDYDLLALDSISGTGLAEADIFPEVDSTWKNLLSVGILCGLWDSDAVLGFQDYIGVNQKSSTFREIQRLLSKTNGKVIGDVMTSAPLVVRETTNLEDAARLLLETKYRRLPVVDSAGKLVGIITRGNVVRAALEIKKKVEGCL